MKRISYIISSCDATLERSGFLKPFESLLFFLLRIFPKYAAKTLGAVMLLCFLHTTNAQTYAWAKGMGGSSQDWGYSIAVDASGNVYTTGFFTGTVDFDPGVGTSNLTSAGNQDIFVSKLDASGNFLWAKSIGSTGSDYSYGIAVDASGNVYTTGYFTGTADFDPGAGTSNLTSAGSGDIFISKLDASGNFVWAKIFGSTGIDQSNAITVDALGNVYTTGYFQGTVDFDPNAGTSNLTSNGSFDVFISKLDASGNYVWAKNMGGSGSDKSNAITVDAVGNVYTTGTFRNTVDFDPGAGTSNLTSAGNGDIFISKLDASGNFVWAKRIGASHFMSDDEGFGIAVDALGNVYTTGAFYSTADFDPGPSTSNLNYSAGGGFISKLDASGNYVWAKNLNTTIRGIALGTSGNVYTTGNFSSTVDFDPGTGISNLTSAGVIDIFIHQLDASGNFVSAKSMGGTNTDIAYAITVDASENIYTTGYFSGTADFNPGTGVNNLVAVGGDDVFISKLGPDGPAVTIAITAGNQTMCVGAVSSVTFTATPTNGGTAPQYQWKKNGNNVGDNSPTYTDAALADGDIITCVLTSNAPNLPTQVATSEGITITVSPPLTPSVAITANPSGTIYTITSVTFTATPTNGFTAPQYQWQKNGANVGTNSPTYTNSTWTNGDVVTCILTSNHPCAAPTTATSNSITISATAPPAGAALNFDGSNDYVNCGNTANLQLSTGTIEGWIKTSGAGASYRGIIVKQLAYSLFLVDGVLGLYNWGGNVAVSTGVNLADNQWHHVALSFQNGVTNGSVIYIDGTARTTFTFNVSNQSVALAIGAGEPAVSQNFNGTIDEVRVWNTVRTASQIANSRSCELAGNETGLVAYYKFNHGVAELTNTGVTTLTDATANANNGTLSNFALTGTTSNWVSSSNSLGAPVTPSVSIAASPSGAITAGTSVTFTATPTNGGAAPTYVWKKNGTVIDGEVSATYTSSTLADGDIITCEMTSNATCATTALAISTGITMSVTAPSTYTWTGATSTDWATATNWTPNGVPTSSDNVIIPTTTNKPMLPANQTIANLSLTGTNKIMLGNSTLCVNAITGGSSSSYVVTDGTGGLIIKALPTNTSTMFPVGASETSYDPLSIRPTNSVDFTVKVKTTANAAGFSGTIANFNKVVPRRWDVTPTGTAGSTLLAAFPSVVYVPTTPKMGHYTGTEWEELSAQYSAGSNLWAAITTTFSPFAVGDAGGFVAVLPVEWLSFTGYNKGGVNVLNWATANEVNNKGFQVERRLGNSQQATGDSWEVLGFITAKNKSSTYQFLDVTPPSGAGGAYYRLRQIDNDGKETFSKVISISSKGSDKLKAYPNPVSTVLTIETSVIAKNEANYDYQIINLLGQQVSSGKAAQRIDVSVLPQGTYFLKLGLEQVKFIKE